MKTCKQEPMTIKETAEALGVNEQRIYYLINTKKIEPKRLGNTWYFTPKDMPALKTLLKKKTQRA